MNDRSTVRAAHCDHRSADRESGHEESQEKKDFMPRKALLQHLLYDLEEVGQIALRQGPVQTVASY